jgi:hypothetical protein
MEEPIWLSERKKWVWLVVIDAHTTTVYATYWIMNSFPYAPILESMMKTLVLWT